MKKNKISKEQQQLQSIGDQFKQKRIFVSRTTLEEVAKKAGVTTLTISKLEKGELKNSSLKTLNAIARALGYEISIELSTPKK